MGNKQSNTSYRELDNIPITGRLSINGNNYIGGLINNIKNGKGIMEFENGDIYDGDWVNDEMHGIGKYQFVNGDIYIGNMINNYMHGKGEISYANGYSCKSNFSFNKMSGQGVYYGLNKIKIYIGEFKNGSFHGVGKLYHETKTKFYSGQFIDGICHGYGKLYSPEGKTLYTGKFNQGELEEYINEELIDDIFELIDDYNHFIFFGCFKNLIDYITKEDNDEIPIVEAKPIQPSAPTLEKLCLVCNNPEFLLKFDCGHEVICHKCLIESQVTECFQCNMVVNRNKYI